MMSLTNGMWINDKYYNTVGCLKAEYCDNNKEKFKEVLQEELMEKVGLITDIQEVKREAMKSTNLANIIINHVKREKEQLYIILRLMKLYKIKEKEDVKN